MSIGIALPPEVWAEFKLMASRTGASLNYCLERILRDVINQGHIPGIGSLEGDERRSNEKYGTATPMYDQEPQQPSVASEPPKRPRPLSS